MNRFARTVWCLLFVGGAAEAADNSLKTVAASQVPSWSGFYIGGHGGYGENDDPFSLPIAGMSPTTSPPVKGLKSNGWVAGGQVGYNWQYAAIVGGFELDASATGIKGNSAPAVVTFLSQTYGDDVRLLGTARGRLGLAPTSDWLFYATGGLAWERLDQISVLYSVGPGGSFTSTTISPANLFGWVLGAGVEARIAESNWIARLEYLHHDFGHLRTSNSVINTVPNGNSNSPVGDQTIDIIRAGLSYKFGG